jgi:hypothetical protein
MATQRRFCKALGREEAAAAVAGAHLDIAVELSLSTRFCRQRAALPTEQEQQHHQYQQQETVE